MRWAGEAPLPQVAVARVEAGAGPAARQSVGGQLHDLALQRVARAWRATERPEQRAGLVRLPLRTAPRTAGVIFLVDQARLGKAFGALDQPAQERPAHVAAQRRHARDDEARVTAGPDEGVALGPA